MAFKVFMAVILPVFGIDIVLRIGPTPRSSSGQQQIVSRETVVDGAKLDENEDDEVKCLYCFGNEISVNIYYFFSG